MIYLFVHQNFPAQYVHLVSHLASQPEHTVYFITQAEEPEIERVQKLVYRPDPVPGPGVHPYNITYENAVRTGLAVLEVCRDLLDQGIVPDLVIGHSGWGETLLIKEVFPSTPLLAYFEFFYRATGADVGFDPEFSPAREDDAVRLRLRNAVNRMSFDACDWGHTATEWQRSLFPPEMQARITTLHEGIDTDRIRPNAEAWLKLARNDLVLTGQDEVITYVSRNLEPYRGFHWFMRSLPAVLKRRPNAHVVVVGGDSISYGELPPYGGSYREMLLAELGDRLDRERVHFLGQVPKDIYINVLQISSIHIYFTYPFVLSWSLLEAMAAGCLVLGSANPPVDEVIRDGENGYLVDASNVEAASEQIVAALEDPQRAQDLRRAARATVVEQHDLKTQILPRWLKLLEELTSSDSQEVV